MDYIGQLTPTFYHPYAISASRLEIPQTAVFEFMETDYIEIGDVVTGALESTACDSIFNHSRNEKLEVNVRDFVTTLEAAEALVVYCD